MTAGERFKTWIDAVARGWADRLRGWMASWLMLGVRDTIESLEDEPRAELTAIFDELIAAPDTPETIRSAFKKMRAHRSPAWWIMILIGLGIMIATTIGSQFLPRLRGLVYSAQRGAEIYRLDPPSVISAWRRDPDKYEKLFEDLKDQGWNPDRIEALKFLTQFRLDPDTWIKALRREYEDFDKIKDDLKHQGWDEDRIEAYKFTTLFMPSALDIVSWYAREVYEPDMVERYGLDSELPVYEKTDFPKIGVDSKQARNYWMAHWVHASYMQIREMIHRGVLNLDKEMPEAPTTKEGWEARDAEGVTAAYDWYRLVEIPPFWRARLTEMMFEVPTRVDVRRFWDMRTIDEERLRSIYHSRGYHGKDLEDYVLWTKVYVAWPDLMARWSKGWIDLEDVRAELIGLGMPAERVEEMIQTKVKAAQPERVESERDLTKTDIYKGVKQGRITRGEALELLIDLGFDEDEADYLLLINIPEDEEDEVADARLLSKTDIRTGFLAEIITEAEARTKLLALRYSTTDTDLLIRIFKAAIKPEIIEEARDLTKSDTLRLFKLAIIGEAEARIMLGDLNYKPEDIELLLEANMPPVEEAKIEEARQLTKADIKTGLRTGLLTVPEVQVRLEALDYTPDDATLLIELYRRVDALRPSVQPREASKADIVLGVKKGLITQEEGYGMLLDLDFSPEASVFILTVRTEETPFSPINFAEFKALTQRYRIATGKEAKPMPEELKNAASLVVTLTGDVEALERSIVEEKAGFIEGQPVPEEAAKRLRSLQDKRRRAEAALATAKSEYDSLVAQWRH